MYRLHCLVLAALMFFLNACSYAHRYYNGSPGKFPAAIDYVLQVDDFGWLWDRKAPAKALKAIKEELRERNTIVVLFVHGWHHNAAPGNANLHDFAGYLEIIREKLRKPVYRTSRQILTGTEDFKVIGIYVGWRGKSLPMPLDYATFWERKAAAERVGEGDLREFLLRLNTIYRDHSAYRQELTKKPFVEKAPFMGLVNVGHSFGAQVLFKVVASSLERELIAATPFTSQPSRTKTRLTEPLQGFGDLTILVNPALEAFQYHRIHELSSQLDYDRRQTPLLLVLSAENDVPRRVAFPIARWLDALFGPPTRLDQRALSRTALGEYEPHRTHKVKEVAKSKNFDPYAYAENPCNILNADLTYIPTIGRVQLEPNEVPEHQPFSPFIVGHASQTVVVGHNGIFDEPLRSFLNDYVAILEGKKMLLGNTKIVSGCPIPAK